MNDSGKVVDVCKGYGPTKKVPCSECGHDAIVALRVDGTHYEDSLHCEVCWLREQLSTIDAERKADKAALCRARMALQKCGELFGEIRGDWTDPRSECREGWEVIESALSSTGPCRHEARMKQLEEAVEWACQYENAVSDCGDGMRAFQPKKYFDELRRRAGKEGG